MDDDSRPMNVGAQFVKKKWGSEMKPNTKYRTARDGRKKKNQSVRCKPEK
jgi:hypothetical protein